jgi:hypothetical protein
MKWGVPSIALASLAAWAGAASARPPVVVELFTAQGCSSCGKASAYIAKLADDKGVLALTYAVDYWDYLGWKDTFAKPEFADRQRDYAQRLGIAEVYTPQVVIDGRVQTPGVRSADIDKLVRSVRHDFSDPPDMRWRGADKVAVGSGRRAHGGADVWLVRYDPHRREVEVKDGDNRGQTVVERNVVVQLERIGRWNGRPVLLKLPPAPQDGLRQVVLVQAHEGGRILGELAQPDAAATK